jgi:hypothetical protein
MSVKKPPYEHLAAATRCCRGKKEAMPIVIGGVRVGRTGEPVGPGRET